MSLITITDEYLAARVATGDDAAFAELARRYRPLLVSVTRDPPAGLDTEDLWQEGLIGLLDGCRKLARDPAWGPFAAMARCNVRERAMAARTRACALKHRVLTEAVHDNHDESTTRLAERLPALGADPARVIELREQLRELAHPAPKIDRRRRFSDDDLERALALLRAGRTLKEAAFAVGASRPQVARWADRAKQSRPVGRRRFRADEVTRAVGLVQGGATLREAAAAVGATSSTVCKWVKKAA